MNSVLTRMAQRALAALPTAKPVKASRFAADAGAARFALRSDGASFGVESFVDAVAAPLRKSRRRAKSSDLGPPEPGPHGLTRERPPAPVAEAHDDERADPPPRTHSSRVTRPGTASHDVPQSLWQSEPAPAVVNSLRAARPGTASPRDVPQSLLQSESARAVVPSLWAPPEPGLEAESRAVSARALRATRAKGEGESPSAMRPAPADEHAAVSSRRARPLEAPAPIAAHPASGGESVEIHISIGSVELRAPKAPAQLPAQPFRPRMSLEEFLRRERGESG
jgi:hypothetical protein